MLCGEGTMARAIASGPVGDDEYLRRYQAECDRLVAVESVGTRRGLQDLEDGVWGRWTGDEQRQHIWRAYADLLRERGLWTGTFWAMNRDGTWRPWSPDELEPYRA
jgi:hypothetical protein